MQTVSQELKDAFPIVGITWASDCCGGHFASPPEFVDEDHHYVCEVCDKNCLITPAWAVRVDCADHGEHCVPVAIGLYMQDGLN
jgi:hypothetical protein